MSDKSAVKCPYFANETLTQIKCKKDRSHRSTVSFPNVLTAAVHKQLCRSFLYTKCETYKLLSGEEK